MTEAELHEQRKTAIHLLRSGMSRQEVAQELERSVSWVHKWKQRYEQEGWAGLHSRSRAPKHSPNRIPTSVRQRVREARSELEAEAAAGEGLRYIGAPAVQARLEKKKVSRIPSTASIERILRAADMTRPHQSQAEEEVIYPRLHPTHPQQLCQVDIVPHFLRGGQAIACFNGIDVISRYPSGQAYERRRSQEAGQFLIQVWQEMGIPQYTQVDNEGCFSGGFTHPGVLGKVVRLALYVGTELVFSPVGHPQSNGSVERFHQDYDQHVWEDTDLGNCLGVQAQAESFFSDYRHSRHHSALRGASPVEVHYQVPPRQLAPNFRLPTQKLPLTEGRVHFMRRVNPDNTISLLNLTWSVPDAKPNQGVWGTLELNTSGATLRVYDAAPDAPERICLVEHPFPLKEPVQPLQAEFMPQSTNNLLVDLITGAAFRLDRVVAFLSTMF
jgi:transposase InsO family protein